MLIPFDQLPDDAKIWLFPCAELLTDAQVQGLQKELESFVEDWLYHSKVVKGSATIFDNKVLCLAADESEITVGGCSLDGMTRFIKSLEQQYEIHCFEKASIIYKSHSGALMNVDFRKLSETEVDGDTIIFNLLARTVGELRKNLWVKLKETPYANYLATA